MHVISAHHFHSGAGATNRSWSPPNRHDVMTGQVGRRDDALEAGQRLMWLEAVWRVTGVDPRELRPHNSDCLRQGSSTLRTSGRGDVLGGDAGRARTHRARKTEEQDGRRVRDAYPRFEERDGRRPGEVTSVRERAAFGGRPAPGSLDQELDQISVAFSSPSENAGEEPPGRDDEYCERAGGLRGDNDGRPRGRGPDVGDGSHAPPDGGDRGGDDDDDGDGGPAKGGGRVTTLWLGPMARGDRQEPEGQGPHGEHAAQTGPAGNSQTADGGAQMQTPAEAQAREGGEDNHHEDASQGGAGAWEWGWWNTGTWQSGSSGSGLWNRPERGNDGNEAWSWWNRGKRAPRTGGYSGADRPRPKPAHTAAALERHLTREEWIEELIADPPESRPPEFRAPGSWESWVRGVFLTYRKTADAKYVQGENEAGQHQQGGARRRLRLQHQGWTLGRHGPEYSPPRGAKAAGTQQGRRRLQGRARGKGGSRGLHRRRVARRESWRGIGRGHRGRKRWGHPSRRPQHWGARPGCGRAPGDGPRRVSSGHCGRHDPGADSGTATHAAGMEGTQGRPSGVSDSVAAGVQTAGAAESMRSEPGQVGEIVGFLPRNGSPGPVVPSHCAVDTTASGGARPGSSSSCDGNAGLASLTQRRSRGPR